MYLQKPTEITILNTENTELCNSITGKFLPESILVTINHKNQLAQLSKYPFFEGKEFNADKTTVFVCKDSVCSLPLKSIPEIESKLK